MGIAQPTMCAAVRPDDFYSYSWWMEEKGRHIIYQINAKKIICLDKKEILRKFVFERVTTKCT